MRGWLGRTGSAVAGRVGQLLPLGLKGARSLRHLGLSPADACAAKHAYSFFEGSERTALYARDFAESVRNSDPFSGFRAAYADCTSPEALDRSLYVDANTYLIDDIMTKVDRASMAVSLEAREPLLDHKLLEFAATVPVGLKLKNGQGKYLLRRLLERSVPTSIVDRPKQGFEAPIGEWLRGPLAPMAVRSLLRRTAAQPRRLRHGGDRTALARAPVRQPRSSSSPVESADAGVVVP